MQNKDGGWGAFDRDNNKHFLTRIPFADHNAMIDPSTADVTARVMESLARLGIPSDHPAMKRGVEFLKHDQKTDGSWYGRWGVNYFYGTGGVLRALEAAGMSALDIARRAADWLRSVQQSDGGFGEIARRMMMNRKSKWEEHAFADRMGADWIDGGGRHVKSRALSGRLHRSCGGIPAAGQKRMDRGMKRSRREPDFRACFI